MCELNIVVFLIFATFTLSFGPLLWVDHEPDIVRTRLVAFARHLQPECYLFRD